MSKQLNVVVRGFALVAVFGLAACGSAKNDCDTVQSAMSNLQSIQSRVNSATTIAAQEALLNEMETEVNRIEPYAGQTLTCGDQKIQVQDSAYIANARKAIAAGRAQLKQLAAR